MELDLNNGIAGIITAAFGADLARCGVDAVALLACTIGRVSDQCIAVRTIGFGRFFAKDFLSRAIAVAVAPIVEGTGVTVIAIGTVVCRLLAKRKVWAGVYRCLAVSGVHRFLRLSCIHDFDG